MGPSARPAAASSRLAGEVRELRDFTAPRGEIWFSMGVSSLAFLFASEEPDGRRVRIHGPSRRENWSRERVERERRDRYALQLINPRGRRNVATHDE